MRSSLNNVTALRVGSRFPRTSGAKREGHMQHQRLAQRNEYGIRLTGTSDAMRKLSFLVGMGIGYVLGARAGRERYEELVKLAQRAREQLQGDVQEPRSATSSAPVDVPDEVTPPRAG
jgi:hypothetical protein